MTAIDNESPTTSTERVLSESGSARNFVLNTKPLFKLMVEKKASDLFFTSNSPIKIKIEGQIMPINRQVLTAEQVRQASYGLMNQEQHAHFDREWELCISLPHPQAGRIRGTFYKRDNHPELSVRFCGEKIPTREQLGLPLKMDELARKPNGLVLITGPTGAGKTTTLNYMIDLINSERRCKIVTVEDPIEHRHRNKLAIVVQQEVLTDTHSYNRALVHILRQDPDVIVVGEMRDHETISAALTAAETGHLVIATMHSPNVAHAFERIVGVFEGSAQRQIIIQLANSLQGIIAQDLLPTVDRSGRVLAYELLVANSAVRNVIRENNKHMLETLIQTGGKDGMVLMDACIYDLYCRALISYDTALTRARNPERMTKKTG